MAMYNEVLVGRYNRILQRLMSMKGDAPSPQMSGDIEPGITLESDRPEWAYLGGDFLAAAPAFKAADAANLTAVGLANASTTGVLGVVEGILVNNENAAAASFNILWGGPVLGTLFRAYPRDYRWQTPNTKRAAISLGSAVEAAISGLLQTRIRLPAGGSIYLPNPYIIAPPASGTSQLIVETDAINTICSATFFWRERALEESEVAK